MTKKLEELFDLPPQDDSEETTMEDALVEAKADQQQIRELDDTMDRIDAALPSIRDIASSDAELDDIADLAKDAFQDLLDLGMNIEPRLASEIFGSASSLLGTALDAKKAKIDNKLKVVQLQIAKRRLDHQMTKNQPTEDKGEAQELDRTELLEQILQSQKVASGETK